MGPLIGHRTNVRQPIISARPNLTESSKSRSYHTLFSPTPTAKEDERTRSYDKEGSNSTLTSSPINFTQHRSNSNLRLRRAQKFLGSQVTSRTSPDSYRSNVVTPLLYSKGEENNSLHDYEPPKFIERLVRKHEDRVHSSSSFSVKQLLILQRII